MSSRKAGRAPANTGAPSPQTPPTPPATPTAAPDTAAAATAPETPPVAPQAAPAPITPPVAPQAAPETPGIVDVDATSPSEQRAAALQALISGEQPDEAPRERPRPSVPATGRTEEWDQGGSPHIVQCPYFRRRVDDRTLTARRGDTILVDPTDERIAWAVAEGFLQPAADE